MRGAMLVGPLHVTLSLVSPVAPRTGPPEVVLGLRQDHVVPIDGAGWVVAGLAGAPVGDLQQSAVGRPIRGEQGVIRIWIVAGVRSRHDRVGPVSHVALGALAVLGAMAVLVDGVAAVRVVRARSRRVRARRERRHQAGAATNCSAGFVVVIAVLPAPALLGVVPGVAGAAPGSHLRAPAGWRKLRSWLAG